MSFVIKRPDKLKTKIEDERFMKWVNIGLAILCAGLIIFSYVLIASAEDYTDNQIANAIYRAENSVKYPYGIKSIDTHGDKVYARKICINTIRNNRKRFANQTKYDDFITFLGSRYCPVAGDKTGLNIHWVKNVKYFLKKQL